MCELGWKSLGMLELTARPSLHEEHWLPAVQETDALLVGGGDVFYLGYWMRQSGWQTSCRRCARRSTWE
jgi:dipeptidase E